MMKVSKEHFIRTALDCKALRFGEFTLKSGRNSPYFFNLGMFYTGEHLKILGEYYANVILDNQLNTTHLFGPAYKGIPLATSTAIALASQGLNVQVSFNRKEAKDHGEGGVVIGAPLSGNITMIDDVITAGTAFRETKQCIESQGARLTQVLIALDRAECGQNNHSAIEEIRQQDIAVFSIMTVYDLIDYLEQRGENHQVDQMKAYLEKYGQPLEKK